MNEARELLERALESLEFIWDRGLKAYSPETHESLMDSIKEYLESEEPVAESATTEPVVSSKMERPFIRLTDEEIREILGPFAGDPISGYTRKLFDEIQDKLEEKNK